MLRDEPPDDDELPLREVERALDERDADPLFFAVEPPLREDVDFFALDPLLRDDVDFFAADPPLRDEDEPLPLRALDERELDRDEEPLPLREVDDFEVDDFLREPEPPALRADDREDEPLPLRDRELLERDDDERELDRRDDDAERRSAAGISSCATAFVSCGISLPRNFCIRSSSRRIDLASFAVSLSPTIPASVSIAV